LDVNNDSLIDFNDYMRRDKYFVQLSLREFKKIDANREYNLLFGIQILDDGMVNKKELHDYNQQNKQNQHVSRLLVSNITLNVSESLQLFFK
jgi:hypothetical protein